MGLAPYGKPKFVEVIKNHLIKTYEDGSFTLNQDFFTYSHKQHMFGKKFENLLDFRLLILISFQINSIWT